MTFDDIPSGVRVFIDANPFIYHFAPNPSFGAACRTLMERIARRDVKGITSAHVLTNVAHRLMTIEAMARFGWPEAGIATRLAKNHREIRNLDMHRQALDEIGTIGIQVLPITEQLVKAAASLSQQYELLSGDALVIAVMQNEAILHLVSHDGDFDRVDGITRYEPT
jgi:predicted nucleic acid-binding protein